MSTDVVNPLGLRELIEHSGVPCVSLFLFNRPSGHGRRGPDPLRFRNLLERAENELLHRGFAKPEAETILDGADRLSGSARFNQRAKGGLAVFCTRGFLRAYRVPLMVDELVVVEDRFYVKPLLPALHSNVRFFILALSQDRGRLYEATRDRIRELELPRSEGKDQNAAWPFHGYPLLPRRGDWEKKDILAFFHDLNRAVTRVLRGQRSPLLLASVGYLASIYETANTYPNLIKAKIPGNPERWSCDELRRHSWQLVEPYFRRVLGDAVERFEQARSSGRASADLARVVLSADQGRVDTLLLKCGETTWGSLDRRRQTVRVVEKPGPDAEELLEFAAVRTVINGGDVYALERTPAGNSPIAASFRD